MSSTDTAGPSTEAPRAPDSAGTAADAEAGALLGRARNALGDALVGSHISAGELWLRVESESWADLAAWLRDTEGFGFFSFLSAIDWMPSPFGRDMDSAVDNTLDQPEPKEAPPTETGVSGGDTRFQLLARVSDVTTGRSVIAKADLSTDDLRAPSWVAVYPGADWHEREAWEMFGIDFDGHPGLRHIYLPGEFEGHPLRKDYPLLARRVKPWPGLVDVELMPETDDGGDDGEGAAP
ncbi:MAG: NADH-quinone oxidoreductase subunit C [Acidimicrobiaceae bacterium]|nr:NADH-quinone oxidoreductase subunit C [Acidimicrobiaceae bacterium]MYE76760.1 NADH-quinone oxidoreductase subunit C [Acidimicrobiaceae bacterium]MYE98400.1 NADH-quinone oxidoreductase subunit C [Acidimicrobiaceae bacterium]MYH42119.1 NADH-quinone oxidoreductase subunit C [Acidimicrobiaceae bacterium]MYI55039.1 NADH-quinone oxidoreductase subunit C [Acidimicrobiaceae bacterium]